MGKQANTFHFAPYSPWELVATKQDWNQTTSEENHTVQANSNPINTSVLSPSRWLTPLPCLTSLPPIPWICGCTRSAELSCRVLMSSWWKKCAGPLTIPQDAISTHFYQWSQKCINSPNLHLSEKSGPKLALIYFLKPPTGVTKHYKAIHT